MIRLGAVVEMVHSATLVHDDIIDAADTRRGRPSANTTWGNAKCVLAGDWLYMQAFQAWLSTSAISASSICSSASPSRWSKANCCRWKSSASRSPRTSTTRSSIARPPASSKSPCGWARCSPGRQRRGRTADGRIWPRPSAWPSRSSTMFSTSPPPKKCSASP